MENSKSNDHDFNFSDDPRRMGDEGKERLVMSSDGMVTSSSTLTQPFSNIQAEAGRGESSEVDSPFSQSPTLSQLIKRRRRCCGGVFESVSAGDRQPSDAPRSAYEYRYAWPYSDSTGAQGMGRHVTTLNGSGTAAGANEEFFRLRGDEIEESVGQVVAAVGMDDETTKKLRRGERKGEGKYDFERDVEGIQGEDVLGTIDNATDSAAPSDNSSWRSASVYSQWSAETDQSGNKTIHPRSSPQYRHGEERESQQGDESTTATKTDLDPVLHDSEIRQRIEDINNSWNKLKNGSKAKGDAKSKCSISRACVEIRRLANGIRITMQADAEIVREKLGRLRIRKGKARDGNCEGGEGTKAAVGGSMETGHCGGEHRPLSAVLKLVSRPARASPRVVKIDRETAQRMVRRY